MRWSVLALIAACGGSKPTPMPERPAPPEPVLPACAPAGEIALPPDGVLACRQLPLTVTFPPGTQLTRQNDRALTLYSAKLDKGVMALLVEPRTDSPDSASVAALLQTLVKGIAANATAEAVPAPALAGATASAALTFTTPDGGAGVARGYVANHWLFAVLAGARSPDSPARADQPAAQAFLASLALRPAATGTQRHALANGAVLEVPASAWSTGALPVGDGVRSDMIYVAAEQGSWIGVRELEPRDRCKTLRDGPVEQLADRLRTMYGQAENPLGTIERAQLGDFAVYAEIAAEPRHVAMYVICAGTTVLQLSVAGEHPYAALRRQLDEIARTFVGAK